MAKMGVKTKKFGGKLYKMRGWRDTKGDAEAKARDIRSGGVPVRITKTQHPVGYAIWARNK